MEAIDKKKLCWNCEGNVSRRATNCPYCGVYLHPSPEDEADEEEEIHSPYQSAPQEEASSFHPPYPPQDHLAKFNQQNAVDKEEEFDQGQATIGDMRNVVICLLLLFSGSVFLLFGLLLLLFSRDGIFTLRWNSQYWFVFVSISLPLIYLGWRALQYLESNQEEEEGTTTISG